jgi:hypothetical protein
MGRPPQTTLSGASRRRKIPVAQPLPAPSYPPSWIGYSARKCQWFLEPSDWCRGLTPPPAPHPVAQRAIRELLIDLRIAFSKIQRQQAAAQNPEYSFEVSASGKNGLGAPKARSLLWWSPFAFGPAGKRRKVHPKQ